MILCGFGVCYDAFFIFDGGMSRTDSSPLVLCVDLSIAAYTSFHLCDRTLRYDHAIDIQTAIYECLQWYIIETCFLGPPKRGRSQSAAAI